MLDLIDLDFVLECRPALSARDARVLVDALNSQLQRTVPALLDGPLGWRAEAAWIIAEALRRPAPWIDSESSGPFSVKYRALASGQVAVLGDADVAALRALCGSAAIAGMPIGAFPSPSGVEGLALGRVR